MLILVNINRYQGGGEVLLIRFVVYLSKVQIPFKVICSTNGFIHTELKRIGIPDSDLLNFDYIRVNIAYLNFNKRDSIVKTILSSIPSSYDKIRFITFTLKDIYLVNEFLLKAQNGTLNHLILHIQDYLFFGQSLLDKLIYLITKKQIFSLQRNIDYNISLIKAINFSQGLISMAEIINEVWEKEIKIDMSSCNIVPLPSFSRGQKALNMTSNKKIIWIGRIVDFKIPALLNIIEYVSQDVNYSLTIVGDGEIKKIKQIALKEKYNLDRIKFLGEIEHSNLENIILNHSIGYAMGTSLIELARMKIPVIVALASYDHIRFKNNICGGLFYNQPLGCDGSELQRKSDQNSFPLIKDILLKIDQDYHYYSSQCFKYAQDNYEIETNFKRYLDIIFNTSLINTKNLRRPPRASNFRILVSKYLQKYG